MLHRTTQRIRAFFAPPPPLRIPPRYLNTQPDDAAFATHLNSAIGKLMSSSKRADPHSLPRIKRALAHLNAARTLHQLGYTVDARAVVARCFHEIRTQQLASVPTLH